MALDTATAATLDRIEGAAKDAAIALLLRHYPVPERAEALDHRRRTGYRNAGRLRAAQAARKDAAAAVQRAEEALRRAKEAQERTERAAGIVERQVLDEYVADRRQLRRRLDQHDAAQDQLEALRADPDADAAQIARLEKRERGVWDIAEALGERTALVRNYMPCHMRWKALDTERCEAAQKVQL